MYKKIAVKNDFIYAVNKMILHGGFFAILVLSAIHLFANQAKVLGWLWHGRFLSFAAGISFAYVFVDLLPALEKGQPLLKQTFGDIVPYFDRHAYLIALIGMLFYYGIKQQTSRGRIEKFWVAISGYLLFNFFIGASLSDSTNPDIQPLTLFTIAMGMHYFVRDHQAQLKSTLVFHKKGRYGLAGALLAGYAAGHLMHIPDAWVAMAVSFLSGGVLLNVLHYELPVRKNSGYFSFLIGAFLYTLILMYVGEV